MICTLLVFGTPDLPRPLVFWHLSDAWNRRGEPNVLLVHYTDLCTDLDGQMRGIATRLGVDLAPATWPKLVRAATFASMKSNADDWRRTEAASSKDKTAFFRRATELGAPELLAWLHR